MKWKKVPGYQCEVTKYGDVRNSYDNIIRNQYNDKDSYKLVSILTETDEWKTRKVHRLVALVFCKGYKKGLQVNHKDLDKSNNYYKNLEWCTQRENSLHAIKNGHYSEQHGENSNNVKLTWEQVINIRFLYSTGLYIQKELAKIFNISISVIGSIIRFESWILQN